MSVVRKAVGLCLVAGLADRGAGSAAGCSMRRGVSVRRESGSV